MLEMLGIASTSDCASIADYLNFVHAEDRGYVRRILKQVAEGGPLESIDYRLTIKDKPELTVHQVLEFSRNSKTANRGAESHTAACLHG